MNRIGRPSKPSVALDLLPQRAESHIKQATFLLDSVASVSYLIPMPMYADVYNALQQRLIHACGQVRDIRQRMTELAPAYNEFIDLREQLKKHTSQINNLKGVFGPGYPDVMQDDKSDVIGETSEVTPSWKEMRDTVPLWIAVREYLAASGEAKVGEVDDFLNHLQFPNVRRQSIESALRRHPKTFRVRKVGKEKLISLKKAG
jgi:hypothetical protein